MENKNLKLYLWRRVLTDWTDGVAFALAFSPEEAKQMVIKSGLQEYYFDDGVKFQGVEPEVIDGPFGFHLYGGA